MKPWQCRFSQSANTGDLTSRTGTVKTQVTCGSCAGAEKGQVKPWQCQAALAVTQTAFCVGSVYLKSSLRQVDSSDGHVFHPIIYAFLREATAGPIMCAMAWFTSGAAPSC